MALLWTRFTISGVSDSDELELSLDYSLSSARRACTSLTTETFRHLSLQCILFGKPIRLQMKHSPDGGPSLAVVLPFLLTSGFPGVLEDLTSRLLDLGLESEWSVLSKRLALFQSLLCEDN